MKEVMLEKVDSVTQRLDFIAKLAMNLVGQQLEPDLLDQEVAIIKAMFTDLADTIMAEQIKLAARARSVLMQELIDNEDTPLNYGY